MTRTLVSARKSLTVGTVLSEHDAADNPEILITTSAVDREGDEVVAEGGDFTAYLRNPVVLFGHNQRDLPVGMATSLTRVPNKGIRARWRWLAGDAFASRVRNAFEQGALRAASIGFIPRTAEPTPTGYRFTKWELLEFSLVPVPANPEAVRTLKHLGLAAPATASDREARIRAVMRALGDNDDTDDAVIDLHSGQRGTIRGTALEASVRAATREMLRRNGLLAPTASDDELELTEDELAELVRETVRHTLRRGLQLRG